MQSLVSGVEDTLFLAAMAPPRPPLPRRLLVPLLLAFVCVSELSIDGRGVCERLGGLLCISSSDCESIRRALGFEAGRVRLGLGLARGVGVDLSVCAGVEVRARCPTVPAAFSSLGTSSLPLMGLRGWPRRLVIISGSRMRRSGSSRSRGF
ncbi:hypothetical protein B0J15DRAFT_494429 [Fusarium solani]|uniref:Uncharacterized protein n=1 Tax=Fusarium solani TaxID=169388 RepID=A0A9P9HJL1_FUSSL|nr:uncharacterized protein B0J15DRAFT_494429 [Fusarium solani]KAH7258814.1 hypothetical protein B0J15DRAFT_494429 [Fusarium solani]